MFYINGKSSRKFKGVKKGDMTGLQQQDWLKFLLKAWWTLPLRKIIGNNSHIHRVFRITQQPKLLMGQKSELNFHYLFLISTF